MNMPVDREYIGDTYNMLVNPKKNKASEKPSETKPNA